MRSALEPVFGAENWKLWAAIILAALGFLLVLSRGGLLFGRPARAPYRRGRFLSANEKCFLGALDEALGGGYRVFAQVRLADLVIVEEKFSEARRRAALNQVFGKSIDFVIVRAGTLDPVAAIEVDDRTHLLPARRDRDVIVNTVFEEIGLPLLRVTAQQTYSAAGLRKLLAAAGMGGGTPEMASRSWR